MVVYSLIRNEINMAWNFRFIGKKECSWQVGTATDEMSSEECWCEDFNKQGCKKLVPLVPAVQGSQVIWREEVSFSPYYLTFSGKFAIYSPVVRGSKIYFAALSISNRKFCFNYKTRSQIKRGFLPLTLYLRSSVSRLGSMSAIEVLHFG